MDNKIKSVEIDGQKIYLKNQKFTGWGVVYPNKNEDGTTNWFNTIVGNRRGVIQLAVIGLIIFLAFSAWAETTASCRDMAQHPEKYFAQCNANCNVAYYPAASGLGSIDSLNFSSIRT